MQTLLLIAVVTFSADTVICSTWGNEKGHFGLYVAEELEAPPMGPTAIGLGQNGLLYIDDCENNRVQAFSPDGKLVDIVEKPHDLGCFWDITADRNGNIIGLVYTGTADTPAFVAMRTHRNWVRIPLPHSITDVRGACRLYPTRKWIYISYFKDGRWFSSRLTGDTTALMASASEGLPAYDGNVLKAEDGVVGFINQSTPIRFSISGMKGIMTADNDTLAVWDLSMFVDFYDDPYVIAPDGTIYAITTSSQNLCVIRFRNARRGGNSSKVWFNKIRR